MTAPSEGQNPFRDFLAKYRPDPVAFVREVLGANPDPKQERVLRDLVAGVRKISIRSGNGAGKTFTLAVAAVYGLVCLFPLNIIVTSPSTSQMFDGFYKEFLIWMKRLPPDLLSLYEIKADRVELLAAPEECFLSVRTSRAETPEAIAGIHAEAGHLWFFADEASGIAEAVYQSTSGLMAQERATTVLLGNPLRSSGYFYETHHSLKHLWTTYHWSSEDCPRVPKSWIEEQRAWLGEGSNAYRVQVLGEFPTAEDDALIPIDWLIASKLREVAESPWSGEVWGLDVGGGKVGGDRSTLCRRKGKVVPEPVIVFQGYNTMQVVGAVHARYESLPENRRPVDINVDSIGMGGPVAERLRELGLPARSINVSESAAMTQIYANLRSEIGFIARAWFEPMDCRLPDDAALIRELSMIQVGKPTSAGKQTMEPKDNIRSRNRGKSIDVADSFLLTFAGGAIIAQQGSDGSNWGSQKLIQPSSFIV